MWISDKKNSRAWSYKKDLIAADKKSSLDAGRGKVLQSIKNSDFQLSILSISFAFLCQHLTFSTWQVPPSLTNLPPAVSPELANVNEQILRLMQSLGIDPARTKEVRRWTERKCVVFSKINALRQLWTKQFLVQTDDLYSSAGVI